LRLVDAVCRRCEPFSSMAYTSCLLRTTTSSRPCITTEPYEKRNCVALECFAYCNCVALVTTRQRTHLTETNANRKLAVLLQPEFRGFSTNFNFYCRPGKAAAGCERFAHRQQPSLACAALGIVLTLRDASSNMRSFVESSLPRRSASSSL